MLTRQLRGAGGYVQAEKVGQRGGHTERRSTGTARGKAIKNAGTKKRPNGVLNIDCGLRRSNVQREGGDVNDRLRCLTVQLTRAFSKFPVQAGDELCDKGKEAPATLREIAPPGRLAPRGC